MTTITQVLDLKKYVIDFGLENGEKIYKKLGLNAFSNRQITENSGHAVREGAKCGSLSYYPEKFKRGKYRPSELLILCKSVKTSPREIIGEFKPKLFKKSGRWLVVDESKANIVLNMICDGYDNQS